MTSNGLAPLEVLYADGKVVTPLFRAKPGDKKIDKSTGEVHYPRAEHDASLHVEGTGEMVWGTKFVLIAARHPHPHSRFIIDVAHVPNPGAEAATAIDHFLQLAPAVSGAQGVIYDTALRGVHHQRLMHELGWLSINRVSAASGSRKQGNGRTRKRIEKIRRAAPFVPDRSSCRPSEPLRWGIARPASYDDLGFLPGFLPVPRL